jgi:hypothetical protein
LVVAFVAATSMPVHAQNIGDRAAAGVSVVVPFTVTRVSENVFQAASGPDVPAKSGGLAAVCFVGVPSGSTQIRLGTEPTDGPADGGEGAMPRVQSVPIDGASISCRSGHGLSLSLEDASGNPVAVKDGIVVLTFGPE